MNRRQKQNLIFSIIAAFGLVLIVSAVWIFSKSWRFNTFTNNQAGYSIKYPADWSVERPGSGGSASFISPLSSDLDIFRENVGVVVQDISATPMTLQEYSQSAIAQMKGVFEQNFIVLVSGPARLANRTGYKLEFIGKGPDGDLHFLAYWTIDGKTAYQVVYTALASQYEENLFKAKRMISSFHLL